MPPNAKVSVPLTPPPQPIQDLGINGKDAQPAKTVDKDGNAIPEPSADFLQEALREQMKRDKKAGKDDGVDMTPEEAKNFEKAFQEPEFRKLMAEYVSEISDPKNRAEQDAYIRQLEGQGEVPEDKEIIRPTPHYTVKFKHVKTAIKNHAIAEDKPWEKTKMFLNVVSSDKVQPAKSTAVNSDGKKGMQWSIPHSLGPVRMEPDKNSSNVATLDCCFHPQTVELSLRSKQFKDLLVETAREACERGFMLVKDEVEIDKTYHMLKGVTYKNGEPAVMIMSKTKSKDSWASKNTKSQEILNAANNKLPDYTKPAAAKQEAAGTPAFQKGFMTAKKTTLKKKVEGADGKNVANGGGGVRGGGVNEDGQDVPEYTISEQGSFDISQQLTGGSANVTRPGSLILKVRQREQRSIRSPPINTRTLVDHAPSRHDRRRPRPGRLRHQARHALAPRLLVELLPAGPAHLPLQRRQGEGEVGQEDEGFDGDDPGARANGEGD